MRPPAITTYGIRRMDDWNDYKTPTDDRCLYALPLIEEDYFSDSIIPLQGTVVDTGYPSSNGRTSKSETINRLTLILKSHALEDNQRLWIYLKFYLNYPEKQIHEYIPNYNKHSANLRTRTLSKIAWLLSIGVLQRCEYCNKLYVPKRRDQRYCSIKCRRGRENNA